MHAISGVSMPPGNDNDALAVAADTIVAADLAALYLGLTPEVLERMRSDGEAPATITTEAAGLPPDPTVSFYSFEELRRWRNSCSPNEVPQALRIQDLRFWTAQSVPFWIDSCGSIVNSATDPSSSDCSSQFLRALAGDTALHWCTPQQALEMPWISLDIQRQLSRQFLECLEQTSAAIQKACQTSCASLITSAGAKTPTNTAVPFAMKDWHQAMRFVSDQGRSMDLRGWTEGKDPFWITETYRIVDSAARQDEAAWDAIARLASSETIALIWLSRLEAVQLRWHNVDRQRILAESFIAAITESQERIRQACLVS